MKKIIALLLAATMLFGLAACTSTSSENVASDQSKTQTNDVATEENSTGEQNISGLSIEVASRIGDDEWNASFEKLIEQFETETGVTVTLTQYSESDYEDVMKTRMASNELPDVWMTHGWSRLRYGDYLYPLNDQAWYQDETDLAKGILEGNEGKGYALMLDALVVGVVCNKTACENLGINIDEIRTLDDFAAACQTAIDAGIVPLVNHNSAGDLAHISGLFTSYPDSLVDEGEAQLDGTYTWESYMPVLEWWAKMLDMGALWDDRATMDSNDEYERLASGKSLFYFCETANWAEQAHNLNPESEFVLIPVPAVKEGSSQYFFGGEGTAFGAWKDSQNLDAALAFLAFLAKNGTPLVDGIPAISTVTGSGSYQQLVSEEAMEKYKDVTYVNMWDREYMPSGMWPVLAEAVGMLYSDHSEENLVAIKDFLKENYQEKYEAAHS